MYLKLSLSSLSNNKQQQRGSMLIIALFVIIVFSLLGLNMTLLLSSSSETVIYEVLGQRALNAARTGLEICLANRYPITGSASVCTNPANDIFAGTPGLQNCIYTVDPSADVVVTDNANTFNYSKFTSTGRCEAGDIIITRKVYVDALEKNP
jgi:MSHA biogenesis protein MshP